MHARLMCIICVDFIKGTLTTSEALRALGELSPALSAEHVRAVFDLVVDEEEAE